VRDVLRSFYEWLTGVTPNPAASPDAAPAGRREIARARVGRYVITHKLGEGGMGLVYAARDERLERTVALKLMSAFAEDEAARRRFWREARAAASVNHPNICQIYEIGEDASDLFIAMELLEGQSLAERLRGGPLSLSDSLDIALGMLTALSALHAREIVHRDLKPSNVFLTPHGVKLLDFGLARQRTEQTLPASAELTRTGMVLGTPRYMAPEQITGQTVDARTDLFAAGAILFEMLAGRPAFAGQSTVDILHATLHEHPPALTGPPIVAAVDRVIRRAMAKVPAERPASADAMAEELRRVRPVAADETRVVAHALTRLVVLPFRVLRSDPETDFLAFSLPDAIATSLSSVGTLIVRSSATAARFAGETPDLKVLAVEADVDRVVMGTIVRAGDQLQAAAQLVDAPSGTLLTSLSIQSSLGDLFRLQDHIAQRIVDALSLPLTRGGVSPAPDAPRNADAYELYLRGNEASRSYESLVRARELYERCLELDSSFAPAWAQLGRCHRVIGKFIANEADSDVRAEEAFRRALALNPRLSMAHRFYAHLEAEIGHTEDALVRLVREAVRHGNDPELFAGLVHACRYCGLFDESIAAHAEARRLDPNVPTSVASTLLLAGQVDRLLASTATLVAGGGDYGLRVIGLGLFGRREEARVALAEMHGLMRVPLFQTWLGVLSAWLDRRPAELTERTSSLQPLKIQDDPEAMFQEAWLLCDAGAPDEALPFLERAITRGYAVAPTMRAMPHFDPLRSNAVFQALLAEAENRRARAREAFRNAGGERLLG
jgi:serine/threonine protein kinase/tetratricopeptide (TPR) repeat protein